MTMTTLTSLSRRRGHRRRGTAAVLTAVALAVPAAGCSTVGETGDGGSGSTATGRVVLVTHDSFSVNKKLLAAFEADSGLDVTLRAPGDAGSLVNQLVLSKDAPLGDAVYGIDNAFASRALDEGIVEPYSSPRADRVVSGLEVDSTDRLTPVDYGDVCVNVDREWFKQRDLAEPETLADLADPAYRDLLVVSNPATSSPGLAFLLATIDAYGDDWTDYWAQLRGNGVEVADSWSDAYYVAFTGGGGDGSRPLVLSYASSPPYTIEKGAGQPSTRALLGTCFRQVEYAGVLAGAENTEGAQELVDFLLSRRFQKGIPQQMYVYPAVKGTPLPTKWKRFAPLADDPYRVSSAEIDANREEWIQRWTATVVG
jgi:thiamine transport system substrate-binding protein